MKIGLALSGGGVLGAAHVGAIKALHEERVKISMVSGTSSGSIVAALYSIGYGADELIEIFSKYDTDNHNSLFSLNDRRYDNPKIIDIDYFGIMKMLVNLILHKQFFLQGFLKGDLLRDSVKRFCMMKQRTMLKDAVMPVAIPAVDIETYETIIFSNVAIDGTTETDCAIDDAVRASIAFPVVFKPHIYKNRRLLDGGLSNNIPAGILKKLGADYIIAVDLSVVKNGRVVKGLIDIAENSIGALTYNLSERLAREANFVIRPEIENVSLLDAGKINECIEIGYEMTKKAAKKIKKDVL